jgi:glycosyltransferase involved in cell wall biosynthesis
VKKLLILAYDFPPYLSVGAQRPGYWYKKLKRYGIEPIVVTRQWTHITGHLSDYVREGESSGTIVRTDEYGTIVSAPYRQSLSNRLLLKYGENRFRMLRRLSSAFLEFAQFFLPVGTRRTIYTSADEFLAKEKVDFILATGDPFVLFHYAAKLGRRYDIPWIADYRDPWSHWTEERGGLLHRFERWQERAIVSQAACFLSVSGPLKAKISALLGGKVPGVVIPNGYDPDKLAVSEGIPQQSEVFRIAHAGTTYDYHPLEKFIGAMDSWKRRTAPKFELVFYGLNQRDRLEKLLSRSYPDLLPHVRITDRLENAEMIAELRRSNLLLMFENNGMMGTKIFDYVAVNRRILLCFDDESLISDADQVTDQDLAESLTPQMLAVLYTRSGVVAKDPEDMIARLDALYTEFCANGMLSCNSRNTAQFSREYQVQRLAEMLRNMTTTPQRS